MTRYRSDNTNQEAKEHDMRQAVKAAQRISEDDTLIIAGQPHPVTAIEEQSDSYDSTIYVIYAGTAIVRARHGEKLPVAR